MNQHQQPQKKKKSFHKKFSLDLKSGAKLFDNNKTSRGKVGKCLHQPCAHARYKRVYIFRFLFSNLRHHSWHPFIDNNFILLKIWQTYHNFILSIIVAGSSFRLTSFIHFSQDTEVNNKNTSNKIFS